MYLTLLSETGIIGAAGFFVFIFFLLRKGLKVFNKFRYENMGYMLLVALAALVGLLTNMAAYELFYWNSPYMIFCLLCGFIQGATAAL
jgi:O-antigen ligase